MGAPRVSTALFGREKAKHSRQGPGKRSLPGQGGKAPARGSCRDDRAKASKTSARGACREGRSRLKTTSQETRLGAICAPAGPGERQASEPGELPGPARSRPRQGTCRGELRCVPALQLTEPRVAPGGIPGTRGGWLCSLGDTGRSTVVKPSPWQTETQGQALLGSTATGIKCSCPPLSK